MSERRLETVFRSERIVVGVSLTILAAAWLYLLSLPATMLTHESSMTGMPGMQGMSAVTMPGSQALRWTDVGALTGMWTVMMVAMMTPAAAPMIATFVAVRRRRAATGRVAIPTAIFVFGYLTVWAVFSVLAALAQTWLHSKALLSAAMAPTTPLLGGTLLITTGVDQWTPLKRACLRACCSPLSFLGLRGSEWVKRGSRG